MKHRRLEDSPTQVVFQLSESDRAHIKSHARPRPSPTKRSAPPEEYPPAKGQLEK